MTPQQYDAWYDSTRGRWIGEVEYRLLRSLLNLQPGANALDVGCGTGWFTRRVAAEGVEVTGLDKDARALDFARQHSATNARYVVGDACCLPIADRALEQVLSVTALCFVERWQQALAEIVRVSRRRFVLGLLNRNSLLWLDKGRNGGQGAYRGAHWHTRAEVDAVLADLPVQRVKYRYGIFLPSGSMTARVTERLLPRTLPYGAFMAVGGDVGP